MSDRRQAGPAGEGLRADVAEVMSRHWRPEGYTSPNAATYPWRWLWDSCFHALIWAELGDERATVELASCFDGQDPSSGFVPHMAYPTAPDHHAEFWGRSGHSSITQPPMFGHTVAELVRRDVDVPDAVVAAAVDGLRFLVERRRRTPAGLVELAHPWESGADDSPRWDDLAPHPFDRATWRDRKGALVGAVDRDPRGAPIGNSDAPVGGAGFSALVAFNAAELAGVTGDDGLARGAAELAEALAARWDGELGTWVDDGPTAAGSGRVRTLDALVGILVDPDPRRCERVLAELDDPSAHGARFGPTGVHRAEPAFDARGYWRGPAWPQLTYLLWVGARRAGHDAAASRLARSLVDGAAVSGLAEYWEPDTGEGLGAIPQSWTGLAVVVSAAGPAGRGGRSPGP